jgi:DNA-binding MarR family transcriptional regulator
MTDRIDISDSLAYRIYRVQRLLRRDLARLAARAGVDLTPEQWFVLNKLRLRAGQSQTDLGDEIFADRPNITRMVAGLERRGLVVRRADPDDARRVLVSLTARGQEVHDRIAMSVGPERDRLFRGITADEIVSVFSVLERIEGNVLHEVD